MENVIMAGIIAVANIIGFIVEVSLIIIFFKRQTRIEKNTNEIIQILNRMELDDIDYSLKDKQDKP